MDDHDGRARLVILLLADPHLLKVDMEGKMEPPILARYSHSGGAMTLTFIVVRARAEISFCSRSAKPGNIVLPPVRSMLGYMWPLLSMGQLMMELKMVL